jgi:gliding motility-associated protein GldC
VPSAINNLFNIKLKTPKFSNTMHNSTITIDVQLDPEKVPQQISWRASDSTADLAQKAKAMMISFWDGADKSALRIDLWTKDMMVDEMSDFFYQTIMTMADTYQRATQYGDLAQDMKNFAKDFYRKFQEKQLDTNKLV